MLLRSGLGTSIHLTRVLCPHFNRSEYENAYSYTTDDWPSITESNDRLSKEQAVQRPRRRPFKAIRRVAGRFVDHVARFPHSQ